MHARCPACGEDCLFVLEPVYDGFKKTGETGRCTGCGATVSPDVLQTPETAGGPDVFGDVTPPETIRIAGQDEQPEFCRYCTHYVTNAFTQRCGLTLQEVEATHTCPQFERAADA